MNSIEPGSLALVINLVLDAHLNGSTVEVCYLKEPNAETFYDVVDKTVYSFFEDEIDPEPGWYGCVVINDNSFYFFHERNLLPIGKKEPEKDMIKDEEICKST